MCVKLGKTVSRRGARGVKKIRRFDVEKLLAKGMGGEEGNMKDKYLQEVLEKAGSD